MSNLHILAGVTVEDEKMFFALALEHHLKRRGRGSMSSLAIDSGISQPQISRIMAGTSMGSVDARIKIAEALGTSLEQMLILGRSLKSGERRSGVDRRSTGRRVSDSNYAASFPHLRGIVKRFPAIARYVEMAELAAMENDLPLVVRLMRTVFDKLEEELGLVQPAERPDNRPSLGGRG